MTLLIIGVGYWAWNLNDNIQSRLAKGWFLPPVEIYTAPQKIEVGQILDEHTIQGLLQSLNFRQRQITQSVLDGDWIFFSKASCLQSYPDLAIEDNAPIGHCLLINVPKDQRDEFLLVFNDQDEVISITELSTQQTMGHIQFEPILFAQYYNDQPIIRRVIQVGQAPLVCLQAVTAIEDSDFLEHKGVSITGTLRAVVKNIVKGRYAEGGSTITQQLVKNFFLSSEKTIKRKLNEQLMAILLELQVDKDTILENYLNVIYMGANGPFQVRGLAAASDHYFAKPLEKLNLPECALLAAVVNNPGRYNPFRHQESATKRRTLVLQKMLELEMIDKPSFDQANESPLPQKPPKLLSEPAPYYVQAVTRKIRELEINAENGLKIYTGLDFQAQEVAQTMVANHVAALEDWYESLKKKKADGKKLQAALVSIHVPSGDVVALVGGRSFGNTQYNRVIEARRQVGSIMKPFVYLTALESLQEDGAPYSPLTLLEDSPFEYKYEGQSWSPQNYDGAFYGTVPMFFALKSSLNAATAKLGLNVGLSGIVDVARRFGIESPIKALPSLTLGAFEMSPWEIARAYTAIAGFGELKELNLIRKVTSANDDAILYLADESQAETVVSRENAAALIGMLKQTLISGTAQSSAKMGFDWVAAGKTGTTSDTKDAWFAGFTPKILTVVWVGFDDNTPVGLTGASGALPIWVKFMNQYAKRYKNQDFPWPQGTYPVTLRGRELQRLLPGQDTSEMEPVEIILRSSDENSF